MNAFRGLFSSLKSQVSLAAHYRLVPQHIRTSYLCIYIYIYSPAQSTKMRGEAAVERSVGHSALATRSQMSLDGIPKARRGIFWSEEAAVAQKLL